MRPRQLVSIKPHSLSAPPRVSVIWTPGGTLRLATVGVHRDTGTVALARRVTAWRGRHISEACRGHAGFALPAAGRDLPDRLLVGATAIALLLLG